MNSWYHAKSAARHFGGTAEDYIHIIEFMDGSKASFGDIRHRAMLHNTWGVWVVQEVFGRVLEVTRESGRTFEVPVREIAERHIIEDLGFIPEVGDWIRDLPIQTWMSGSQRKQVSREEFSNG